MTFADINDTTGFAFGDLFSSEEEVRNYFQRDELLGMMSGVDSGDIPSQATLDEMAQTVIDNGWHRYCIDKGREVRK